MHGNPLRCTAVEPEMSNGRQQPGNLLRTATEPRRGALRVHPVTQALRPHLASPRLYRNPTTATCCLRPSQTQPQQAGHSTWAQPPRLPARAAQSPGTARATRGSCDAFCSVGSFTLFPASCGCARMLGGGSLFFSLAHFSVTSLSTCLHRTEQAELLHKQLEGR